MSQQNADMVAAAFKGWVITGEATTVKGDGDWEEWGRFYVKEPETGRVGYIEPSCDPEGNAPGFCFFDIEEDAA